MKTQSLSDLRDLVRERPAQASVACQAEQLVLKESANGKPYYELRVRDAAASMVLRAWNDTPAFSACEKLEAGRAIEVTGEFHTSPAFGFEAKRWTFRELDARETEALFAGDSAKETEANLVAVNALVQEIADPRLAALCRAFLDEFGPRFARAAAARNNHHARRGGLLAHTLQMMRSAVALCGVYPHLNRDLLVAGVLFHDAGKLWETCPPERGFEIPREIRGELLGHISIGVEVVNALWRGLPLETWAGIEPPSETVRLHLLHLIASHHGELEFGSPVQPKTPEAIALHFIDNLDARLEMLREAHATLPEIAPGILDRTRPLGVNPVYPLPPFSTSPEA